MTDTKESYINPKDRAREVLERLVRVMGLDNGCSFKIYQSDYDNSMPIITSFLDLGYFTEYDESNIDSDYWMMAAGEEVECKEYFSKVNPLIFESLHIQLNEIFNRGCKI